MGIELNTDSSGSAAGSLNEGFGGFSGGLRSILDFFYNIDQAFDGMVTFLKGTFLGWENIEFLFGVFLS